VSELATSAAIHCPVYICDGGVVGILAQRAAKHAVSSAASSVFDSFASWVVRGAAWLVARAIALIIGSTRIDVNTHWFEVREANMARIALLLVLPLVLAATIGAIVRQDTRRLVRIYGVGIPVGAASTVTVLLLTEKAMAIVNALCTLITSRHSPYAPFSNIDGDMNHHHMPLVVELIVGSVIVVAGLMLWLELILRAVVIDIAVFFLPLGLAAIVWPATAHITKRFIEMLVAIIGSKFVIVATLSLGAAMVEQHDAGVDDAIKAAAILLLAAFAPFALLRLIPILEIAAASQLEGMSRRPMRAAAGVAATAAGGAKGAAGLLLSGAGGGGVEGGSVMPTDIAPRRADLDIGSLDSSTGSSTAGSGGDSDPPRSGSGGGGAAGGGGGDGGGGSGSSGGLLMAGAGSSGAGSSGGGSSGGGSSGGGSSGGIASSPAMSSTGGALASPALPAGEIQAASLASSGGTSFRPSVGGGLIPGGASPTSEASGRHDEAPAWPALPDPADLSGPMPILEPSVPGPPPAWNGAGTPDD
jgi:hypothetical protein